MTLLKPHLTEKSMAESSRSTFTFVVSKATTKSQVRALVESTFGVHVTRVNTRLSHIPSKFNNARRTKSVEGIQKLATVQLKKGESIALFEFKDEK